MVFAEATQYPPWRHCLLCRGCAMVFMGGGKKSWLSTIFFVGRAFCSLPDTAFQPDQGLVLLSLGFRDRVFALELFHTRDGEKPVESNVHRRASFFDPARDAAFCFFVVLDFEATALSLAHLSCP